MWADNETADDLIGFRVHSDLIRDVVTDAGALPVVIGVFGDWGGGKSSVMKMLQDDLEDETKYPTVACLHFNGWMFEGYEDAKSALLSSILVELGEHKRFGPKVRDQVTGLLRRVQWMEVGKLALKHVVVPIGVAALHTATGGASLGAAVAGAAMGVAAKAATAFTKAADSPEKDTSDGGAGDKDEDSENWLKKIVADPGKPDLLEVRKFRIDFESMLADTGITSLVVLIDDLDRCLPDRIIDTLEAIKLFVAVPKTAFVIGADPRIVRHAIATRYAGQQAQSGAADEAETEEYDLVKDYLEKLIQVPYHLPRLSPAEMETYINLLLCSKYLPSEHSQAVRERVLAKRQENCYTAFGLGEIRDALAGSDVPPELAMQFAWSAAVALPITEGLKGNPRQVKRMLNAMQLRTRLAKAAKLSIRPEVLAKLMVLEYVEPDRFRDLDRWQSAANGFPEQLRTLEQGALADAGEEGKNSSPSTEPGDTQLEKWLRPRLQAWLRMEPALSAVDLRDYFWIARDRTKSTLASATMVPPFVSALYRQLIGDNDGERIAAVRAASELENGDSGTLMELLGQHVMRHPDHDEASEALRRLAEAGTRMAAVTLLDAIGKVPADGLSPSAPDDLAAAVQRHPDLREQMVESLKALAAKSQTKAGRAAGITLKGLAK